MLERHFLALSKQDKDKAATEVYDHLTDVRDDPHGINTMAVTYSVDGVWCSESAMGYTHSYSSTSTSFYRLCESETFNTGLQPLARTMIHEALHRINGWNDGKLRPIDDSETNYKKVMVFPKALTYPDAYAMFAMEVAVQC